MPNKLEYTIPEVCGSLAKSVQNKINEYTNFLTELRNRELRKAEELQAKIPSTRQVQPSTGKAGLQVGSTLEKVSPPDFPEDLKEKILEQYPGESEKAYATMWMIHDKYLKSEVELDKAELAKITPPSVSEKEMHELKRQYKGKFKDPERRKQAIWGTAWKIHQAKQAKKDELEKQTMMGGGVGMGRTGISTPMGPPRALGMRMSEMSKSEEWPIWGCLVCQEPPTQCKCLNKGYKLGKVGSDSRFDLDQAGVQLAEKKAEKVDYGSAVPTSPETLAGAEGEMSEVGGHDPKPTPGSQMLASAEKTAVRARRCPGGHLHLPGRPCPPIKGGAVQKNEDFIDRKNDSVQGKRLVEPYGHIGKLPSDRPIQVVPAEGSGGIIIPGKAKKMGNVYKKMEPFEAAKAETYKALEAAEGSPEQTAHDIKSDKIKLPEGLERHPESGEKSKVLSHLRSLKDIRKSSLKKFTPPMAKPPSGKDPSKYTPAAQVGSPGPKVAAVPKASANAKPKLSPSVPKAPKGATPIMEKTDYRPSPGTMGGDVRQAAFAAKPETAMPAPKVEPKSPESYSAFAPKGKFGKSELIKMCALCSNSEHRGDCCK